ncbi:protein kinase domain-containing protein [Schlesneria sp. DSM 10557]|uniref:protein kinase domain-containing protein n=1 Tax=Schlesneria sp. DSM 10557 TaxID=3044399 RepID=UPI0035A112F0
MTVPLHKFLQQLEESGILTDDTIKDFIPPKASPQNAEDLARHLVRQKKLTKFQVEEISKGKGKSLTLGNYVLMEKIGAGGMGQVFKARHRVMERLVAVKVLPTAMTKDQAAIARFHREVKAAAKLIHPNIVTAYDADQSNGIHFLVMQLVEGRDLSVLVKKGGPLSVEEAVNYVLQAAKGLEAAHKKGIVHRDIKPANLLLDTEGTVKILDMGLARLSVDGEDSPQADLTSTGTIMGTVDYMAPEQALDTKSADARADIYALGCSLYFLLTGKSTYEGETLMKKLLAHREQPIPALRTIHPEVTEELEVVFKKLVAKKVEDRYQSMTEVIIDLQRCTAGPAATITHLRSPTTTFENGPFDFLKKMPEVPTIPANPKAIAGKTGSNKTLALIGVALLGVMILAGIIVSLKTKDGKLIVDVNQSDAMVQVLDADGQVEISQKGGSGQITIDVDPGKHSLKVVKDGFSTYWQEFEMPQNGKKEITAKLVPLEHKPVSATHSWHGWPPDAPQPAVAPFDAEQAKKYQEEWAAFLKAPIEYTNSIGMKFRMIPPGEFMMGSTDEEIQDALQFLGWKEYVPGEGPRHKVVLSQPIYVSIHEVTQEEYQRVMNRNPAHFAPQGSGADALDDEDTRRFPVESVSWVDAAEFCAKLSQQQKLKPWYSRFGNTITQLEGTGYRLPTEAEWEFACRAGTTTKYWFGDQDQDLILAGWIASNSAMRTHTTGELKPNPFGLFDLSGNVWEWLQDSWDPGFYSQFDNGIALNPISAPSAGSQQVVRGGCFLDGHSASFRSAGRRAFPPDTRGEYLGIRVCLPVEAVKQHVTTPAELSNEVDKQRGKKLGF